jgi:transcriptional regulator with XRE-family HTH domain
MSILWLTRSYNFTDKNPECDRFRTVRQKEKISNKDLAILAGLSKGTVDRLFGGKTMDPKHSTFAKLAGAMQYGYTLTRTKEPNYEVEIPKATKQFLEYRAYLKKRGGRKSKKKTNGKA